MRSEKPPGTSQKSTMLPEIVLTFYCFNKLSKWSQNFWKFSAFSLEFQKFFLITRTIFSQYVRTILVTKYQNLIVFIPQNPLNFFSVSLWPPWVGWGPGALCHQWPRHTHKERNRPRNRVFHATILTHQVGAYQSLRSCLRPEKKMEN